MLTFIVLTDKEAVQCPMAKGSVCACGGGGWRRRGEETREKRPGNFPPFFSVSASDEVEGKSKQVGGDKGEELQTFSGVRLSDAVGTTRISPMCPKVRRYHWYRCDPH